MACLAPSPPFRFGITGPHRLVIHIVGRFPNIVAGQLAAILHLHPSTLWDRRRVGVRLTEDGRRLTRPAVGSVEIAVKRARADFDDEKIASTLDLR
jgi:hypothetical protein